MNKNNSFCEDIAPTEKMHRSSLGALASPCVFESHLFPGGRINQKPNTSQG
jgi:hypothetical protein